ncbi:MAG: ribonuclease Y [Caldisericia bacterium]|nr:ribonuclease Y [Caldisericia bacterium]
MNTIEIVIGIVIGIVVGSLVTYYYLQDRNKKNKKNAQESAEQIISIAEEEGRRLKKEITLQAKDESYKIKSRYDKENSEKQRQFQKKESYLQKRESDIEKKFENIDKKQKNLNHKEGEIQKLNNKITTQIEEGHRELQRISNLSEEDAKKELFVKLEQEYQYEIATRIKAAEDNFKEVADQKARRIVTTAIQRIAVDQTSETTISVVPLPSDDIKGKIIGREGRNIRIFESLTGVDLLIDDTPEVVTISSYDPIKREVGKLALEKLILDGRIHPARIEELFDIATKEVDSTIFQEGEDTLLELGIRTMNPELIKLLGRLKYRSSYSQNVLNHSKEVALLCAAMAAEIGENISRAKRAGLLHDIGKAIDKEIEGSHAALGADVLKKYGESTEVINAAASHHGDVPATCIISGLVQAADAISASRPGARKEDIEAYVRRIESLERICNDFDGVEKSYAVQAGRELRIIVKPNQIDDVMLTKLSYDIVNRVEGEVEYPGQIKVTVIRETRSVAYAK